MLVHVRLDVHCLHVLYISGRDPVISCQVLGMVLNPEDGQWAWNI